MKVVPAIDIRHEYRHTADLGLHVRVASRDASYEKASMASFPQAKLVSATRGTHNQSSSSHLASLALCFLPSMTLSNQLLSNDNNQITLS